MVILLKVVSDLDPLLAIAGPLALLYLLVRKAKTWSDNHPDATASILDKIGLHKMARTIWDKLAAKKAEEEADRYLGVSI